MFNPLVVNIRTILFFFCWTYAIPEANAINVNHNSRLFFLTDTTIVNVSLKDSLINDFIKGKANLNTEKVQWMDAYTKTGFKDLFLHQQYNSKLPYATQINPNAERFMHDYLLTHTTSLLKLKKYAGPYFDLINNVFSGYGLPVELKYLAVIESSLQKNATSLKGAAGPWQFMPETARDFGLVVNHQNDERRDYIKSSKAAGRMLLSLYKEFNDWLLVIAAYNGGKGRVYDAIKKSGSRNFWTLQHYLPIESKNHVKKFIATHYIMEGDDTLNNNQNNRSISLHEQENNNLITEKISGRFIDSVIVRQIALPQRLFNTFNPNFSSSLSTQGYYLLRLPADKMKIFMEKKMIILNECIEILIHQ